MAKGKGDLHPHITKVDNDTRTILHMDIGPKVLKGSGSGKITSDIKGAIAQANKKCPKR